MPDLDQIKQGEQEARDRRSLMFLVIWAMSMVLLGGVGGAAEESFQVNRWARRDGLEARRDGAGGAADFGITPALHRESIRVVSRHAKTRQKQLAVRGAAQLCGARHEARRNAAQARNDRARFIEPSHMYIARGENAV
jgi:hypothetical protein